MYLVMTTTYNILKVVSIYKDIDSNTTRKPSCWEEAKVLYVEQALCEILFGRLPVVEITDSEYHPLDDLMEGLRNTIGQRFMLNKDGKTYYVNNEGYNYCRYIARIQQIENFR